MLAIGESLKQFWLSYDIKLRRGASESELQEFEAKHNVLLPDDLKDYFATVDGFDGSVNWMTDENVITFLSLAEVLPSSKAWSLETPDADSYFVFADFSLLCHVYMVRLRNDLSLGNPVFIARDEKPEQIAGSFSEFVQGYLADDYGVLFPQ
jgi:hypothetical protein